MKKQLKGQTAAQVQFIATLLELWREYQRELQPLVIDPETDEVLRVRKPNFNHFMAWLEERSK